MEKGVLRSGSSWQFAKSLLALPVVALVGCGGAEKTVESSDGVSTQGRTASGPPAAAVSTASDPMESMFAKPSVQLEEVLYLPAQGAAPFIEISNSGSETILLKQLTLMVDSTPIPLEQAADTLAPGALLLVVLDGPRRADALTYHAGDIAISAEAGRAAILDKFGVPIDEVAWGKAAGAVNPFGGGLIHELDAGTSIGRAPGASQLRSGLGWIGYPPAEVTPGSTNPPSPVRILHPLHGARTSLNGASLSWFPVPGVTGYRVQVAADESFAKLELDQSTTDPEVNVSTLRSGKYAWRVQSQFVGKKFGAWSATSMVTLIEETETSPAASVLEMLLPSRAHAQTPTGGAGTLCPQATIPLAQEACWILPVPLIKQHKDTQMLLLEHNSPSGSPHPWDADHGDLKRNDPADNANCALAAMAMMNRYAGGDLSQDRIGYEIFKNLKPGPEDDLMYGEGVDDAELAAIYRFSLGTTPHEQARRSVDTLWRNIKRETESGRPVLAVRPGHAFVIVGYKFVNNNRVIVANDPWENRRQEYNLGDAAALAEVTTWRHWLPAGSFTARQQEPSVLLDSDSDGVVDFDETQRFRTKPDNNDTDSDGVGDKQDILASVFDSRYGYAKFRTGRDEDRDGQPMELDPDSDGGGCLDGMEDTNANGIYEGIAPRNPETWNFKFLDDSCQGLAGHLTYRVHSSGVIVPDMQWGGVESWTGINVRLKPVPNEPGNYEDDGSTFQHTGSRHGLMIAPGCRIITRSWASSSGDFTGAGAGIVQAGITTNGKLGLHFVAGIRPEDIGGWGDICGVTGSGQGGASHSAEFPDECWGDPVEPSEPGYVPGTKTFHFNCHEQHWDATGTISVP